MMFQTTPSGIEWAKLVISKDQKGTTGEGNVSVLNITIQMIIILNRRRNLTPN